MPNAGVARARNMLRRVTLAVESAWRPFTYDCRQWEDVEVVLNSRFKRRLGAAHATAKRISLRGDAAAWPARRLREVLTHELAHLFVHSIHPGAKAHGEEWRALMRAAGLPDVARAEWCGQPSSPVRKRAPAPPSQVRVTYAHRCPVCQMVQYAKRPVHRWRCRSCAESGLDGLLEITQIPANA
jgi:predicted SprT family Zn-dependent metalloprotease